MPSFEDGSAIEDDVGELENVELYEAYGAPPRCLLLVTHLSAFRFFPLGRTDFLMKFIIIGMSYNALCGLGCLR